MGLNNSGTGISVAINTDLGELASCTDAFDDFAEGLTAADEALLDLQETFSDITEDTEDISVDWDSVLDPHTPFSMI